MNYIKLEPYKETFSCPHCHAITQQTWWSLNWHKADDGLKNNSIRVSKCVVCRNHTLWIDEKMYYPDSGNVPSPNEEMPEEVKALYYEAASIMSKSPRGAAALLRLGVQLLCKELGEKGEDINKDISDLVKKGLPEVVQQSLDIVRVTGNDAVHPGQIDTDDEGVVIHIFDLLNIIVEYMIALPKKVSGIYSTLPNKKLEAIDKRDKK